MFNSLHTRAPQSAMAAHHVVQTPLDLMLFAVHVLLKLKRMHACNSVVLQKPL